MATTGGASVLSSFTTDCYPSPVVLVRSINEMRWWSAVLTLEENPNEDGCDASHQHGEWTWRLTRTSEIGIYTQNTYYNGNLMTSNKMNTNIDGRADFIANYFPNHKPT